MGSEQFPAEYGKKNFLESINFKDREGAGRIILRWILGR
jgi:hypothetical protein